MVHHTKTTATYCYILARYIGMLLSDMMGRRQRDGALGMSLGWFLGEKGRITRRISLAVHGWVSTCTRVTDWGWNEMGR